MMKERHDIERILHQREISIEIEIMKKHENSEIGKYH